MALALELADSQYDRTTQPQSLTTQRRQWQNREGRGQANLSPSQQPSPHTPASPQPSGGSVRVADQTKLPLVRVSQAEKAERARLGLCCYCPEKRVVGHVCEQRLLCYAEEGDEGAATDGENVPTNAARNGGSNLDVPNDEAIKEIDKTDNMPLQGLVGVYDEKIGEEEETLLEDGEENGTIGEVEKIIASFKVAQMSSTDGANYWFKRGGACTDVRIIAYFYVDFVDGHVPSIVLRSTSLDVDARFIPPCNDTPYLSVLGGDKGRHSTVRYVFDPGGDALHSSFYQRSSWLLVPTLRTRWISTVGELIRFHILGYHN